MSNLSSARQNSFYINSKGSLKKLHDGQSSSRKVDYQNVDFGYKNKETPNIPGIILNEQGKIDMATFLSDNQDLINIEESGKEMLNLDKDSIAPKSARLSEADRKAGASEVMPHQKFALDLDKLKLQKTNGVFDAEMVFQQSSLSSRSGFFSSSNQLNHHILMKQQQQNQNLMQAMQGQNNQLSGSRTKLTVHQPFEFFVDEYSDD